MVDSSRAEGFIPSVDYENQWAFALVFLLFGLFTARRGLPTEMGVEEDDTNIDLFISSLIWIIGSQDFPSLILLRIYKNHHAIWHSLQDERFAFTRRDFL